MKQGDQTAVCMSIIEIYGLLTDEGKKLMLSLLPNGEQFVEEFEIQKTAPIIMKDKHPEYDPNEPDKPLECDPRKIFDAHFEDIVFLKKKITSTNKDHTYSSIGFDRAKFVRRCRINIEQLLKNLDIDEAKNVTQIKKSEKLIKLIRYIIEKTWK